MGGCNSVEESTVAVVEHFGRFDSLKTSGLACVPWFCCFSIAGKVSLRVQQLVIKMETKTRDNVFVTIQCAVQYRVVPDKVYDAFYKLQDREKQISAHVCASLRARAPKIGLDQLFEVKEDLATDVKKELKVFMEEAGMFVIDVLIMDIEPAASVREAMNEINAADRNRVAAISKAETAKILRVKEAEADAEARFLAGQGIARARAEIIKGLEMSVSHFTSTVENTSANDVMQLILSTQYYDVLKDLGTHSKASTVFVPTPNIMPGQFDHSSHMRQSMLEAAAGAEMMKKDT